MSRCRYATGRGCVWTPAGEVLVPASPRRSLAEPGGRQWPILHGVPSVACGACSAGALSATPIIARHILPEVLRQFLGGAIPQVRIDIRDTMSSQVLQPSCSITRWTLGSRPCRCCILGSLRKCCSRA